MGNPLREEIVRESSFLTQLSQDIALYPRLRKVNHMFFFTGGSYLQSSDLCVLSGVPVRVKKLEMDYLGLGCLKGWRYSNTDDTKTV